MTRINVLSLAIKTKLVLPSANCVDGAYAYSDGDLQDSLYEFARAIERATLEHAAQYVKTYGVELCADDKDMRKHYLRTKSTRELYADAVRKLAKEPTE